jgi:hypothetical protein
MINCTINFKILAAPDNRFWRYRIYTIVVKCNTGQDLRRKKPNFHGVIFG